MPRIELIPNKQTDEAAERQRRREATFGELAPITPATRNDMLAATAFAGQGTYRGGVLPEDFDLTGVRGAAFDRAVTINGTGIVRGFVFNETVLLGVDAKVSFMGCTFQKAITVTAGGKIVATGCLFDGTSAILNAGAAADSGIVGGIKISAVAHTNTTVIFEV
jgi:hypothetical protein